MRFCLSSTMKYVALLSGGKDSCFNLVHCSLNGHELVAAASLRPEVGKGRIYDYVFLDRLSFSLRGT